MKTLLAAVISAILPLTAQAAGAGFIHGYDPGLQVNPISATQFEVIEARGAGAQDIWCAAARYTELQLGITRGRLYVEVPRGPARTAPGRKGVVFTTREVPGARTSTSVSVRQAGLNLPIFHALQFCRNYIWEDDF